VDGLDHEGDSVVMDGFDGSCCVKSLVKQSGETEILMTEKGSWPPEDGLVQKYSW
jgi:hypothetical protein